MHHPHAIIGDFSIDLRKPNWLSKLLEPLGYSQKVKEPTTNDLNCIDGAFIHNNVSPNATLYVLDEVFSFHRPLYCRLKTEIDDGS